MKKKFELKEIETTVKNENDNIQNRKESNYNEHVHNVAKRREMWLKS